MTKVIKPQNKPESMSRDQLSGIVDLTEGIIAEQDGQGSEEWNYLEKHKNDVVIGRFVSNEKGKKIVPFSITNYGLPHWFNKLEHGKMYKLPHYVAVHIKKSGQMMRRSPLVDIRGRQFTQDEIEKLWDFECKELKFLDGDHAPVIDYVSGDTVQMAVM